MYSCVEEVLLWLGDENEEMREAFHYVKAKETLCWPEDWDLTDLSRLETLLAVLE